MKFLALLVLLGVSTILVSCQDMETDSPDTSETGEPECVSTDGNTGYEIHPDTTGEKKDDESSDSANKQSESTGNTNTVNEASEEDNKEETEDDNSNQKEKDDHDDDEDDEDNDDKSSKPSFSNMIEKMKDFFHHR